MNSHEQPKKAPLPSLAQLRNEINAIAKASNVELEFQNRGIKVALEQLNNKLNIGAELSQALQANNLSPEQLIQLETALTNDRKIFMANRDELIELIELIGNLALRIDFDREGTFTDQRRKTALINTMAKSMDIIFSALRDQESGKKREVSVRDHLAYSFDIAIRNITNIISKDGDEGDALTGLLERCQEVRDLIEQVNKGIKINRDQAIKIGELTHGMLGVDFTGDSFTPLDTNLEGYQTLKDFLHGLIQRRD